MPTHFTYSAFGVTESLQQGDILKPTDEMRAVFEKVHPHFQDPKYIGFMVLTQTCDLVQRDGRECKSRYISLCVIRSLGSILFSLLDSAAERVSDGVYVSETKDKARMLLQRLFNQNEQSLGLFYLHPDADAGIAEPAVSLLQVSIALRSNEHYETVRKARVGRLKPEFQGKLGWLVGNLFARVGTQDWPEQEVNTLIRDFLDGDGDNGPAWVPRKGVKSAKSSGVSLDLLPRTEVIAMAIKCLPKSPLQEAIEQVVAAIMGVLPDTPSEDIEKIAGRLRNNLKIRA